jgi:DNA polymerase I
MQLLIDANSIMHRSFHALPPLTMAGGRPAGAIYGFFSSLIKATLLFNPDKVIAAFDRPEPTFRHKEFKEYKGKRAETPNSLREQLELIKTILPKASVNVCSKAGYEADDVIASLVEPPTIILTGDQDLIQLVKLDVKIALIQGKDLVIYDEEKVKDVYGFTPSEMTFFKALCGDASDNIPGVPGIGKKTALDLVQRFNTLDNLYKKIDELPERIKENIKGCDMEQSVRLVTVCSDAKIDCAKKEFSFLALGKTLQQKGFLSLAKRLGFDGQMKIF